jgi:hypothetical protein
MADALAAHGPEALFLARIPPDQFVTVSAWSAWDRIAASTGGNLRQPIATRHSELLEGGTAVFYEIVPNTPHGRVDGAASSDTTSTAGEQRPQEADKSEALFAIPEQPAIAPGT